MNKELVEIPGETEMKQCWVCLRITPEQVLKFSHKIWSESPDVARKIGIRASEIIELTYQKNPIFCCGKRTNTLLSGLFYLLGFLYESPQTLPQLCLKLKCKEPSARNSYYRWLKAFPKIFSDFQMTFEGSRPRLKFKGKTVYEIYSYLKKKRIFEENFG